MVCEDEEIAKEEFGISIASKLHDRLSDIISAMNIFDIPVGNPVLVIDDGREEWRLNITEGYFLLLSANHANLPAKSDGSIDWQKVTRVKIMNIQQG